MTSLARVFRHLLMNGWRARSAFPQRTLGAIEAAIAAAEQNHGGEIRFAVESELSTAALIRDVKPRDRALQVFGELGVWNTEHNNGVLLYVLLADRDVEIIADRGYEGKVTASEWSEVCAAMERAFRDGAFERGAVDGVAAISKLIARHYPTKDRDELPNAPAMI